MCLTAQVNEWLKNRLTEKFMPLSEKPDSVKQDLEKLQKEVRRTCTCTHTADSGYYSMFVREDQSSDMHWSPNSP